MSQFAGVPGISGFPLNEVRQQWLTHYTFKNQLSEILINLTVNSAGQQINSAQEKIIELFTTQMMPGFGLFFNYVSGLEFLSKSLNFKPKVGSSEIRRFYNNVVRNRNFIIIEYNNYNANPTDGILKFFDDVVTNLILPVYYQNGMTGNDFLKSVIPLSHPNDSAVSLINKMLVHAAPGENVFIFKSGTGTGKSVALTTILIDSAYIFGPDTTINYNNTSYPITDLNVHLSIPTMQPKFRNIKKIAVLQPRIFNVTGNAKYIANIYNTEPGKMIGYKYKGEDLSTHNNQVLTMYTQESFLQTILNKNHTDRIDFINKFNEIILDEAHEMSIVNEILLYIFKKYHKLCSDTSFVILSATINPEKYIDYFYGGMAGVALLNHPQICIIEGKLAGNPNKNFLTQKTDNYMETIVETIKTCLGTINIPGKDDIIVFLPGVGVINKLYDILLTQNSLGNSLGIYKIHRGQSSESEKIVQAKLGSTDIPKNNLGNVVTRRIFLGTNKAETGITIDSLGIVIDSGYRNLTFYDPEYNITCSIKCGLSRNNAEQRFGRVGRKPGSVGHIYPIYTEETFYSFPEDDYPGLLMEKFDNYYGPMLELAKQFDGTDDILHMDTMTKGISWVTIVNHNISYKKWNTGPQEIQDTFLRLALPFWQTNCILQGLKNDCVYEMLIMISAHDMEIPIEQYMIDWCKEVYPNLRFLGTLIPKICFLKHILSMYPGVKTIKHIEKTNNYGNCTAGTDLTCSTQFDGSKYYEFIDQMHKLGMTDSDLIKKCSQDLREYMLDLFTKCYDCNIKIRSSANWETVYHTLLDGLDDNIAESIAKEPTSPDDVYNFYNIKNNPSLFGIMTFDHEELYRDYISFMKKIKYTEIFLENGTVYFKDFIAF